MKPQLILIVLIFCRVYIEASPKAIINDSIIEYRGNDLPISPGDSPRIKKDTNEVSKEEISGKDSTEKNKNGGNYTPRDTTESNKPERNNTEYRTSERVRTDRSDRDEDSTIIGKPRSKKDKRGVLSFTLGWQDPYQYLGSYYIPAYNYTYAQLRYKFWFGLFGSVSPQFLLVKYSPNYVGTNFTVGFDNEWFRNFHVLFSYTYCAHEENAVRTIQDLYSNDFDAYVYYSNKYITPEIRYDLTFGVVSGISLNDVNTYTTVKVLGGDNVINAGLSHTFTIVDDKPGGDLSIKLGDYVNIGTANALLTRRVLVADQNSGSTHYVDVPYTGDKFGPLNDEANLTIYYTWRCISIDPYISFSVPFKNIAAEQASLGPVNIDGVVEQVPSNLVTKPFFFGGVTLVLKYPSHKVKRQK